MLHLNTDSDLWGFSKNGYLGHDQFIPYMADFSQAFLVQPVSRNKIIENENYIPV